MELHVGTQSKKGDWYVDRSPPEYLGRARRKAHTLWLFFRDLPLAGEKNGATVESSPAGLVKSLDSENKVARISTIGAESGIQGQAIWP